MQYVPFYIVICTLLHCNMYPFTTQEGTFCKPKRYLLTVILALNKCQKNTTD